MTSSGNPEYTKLVSVVIPCYRGERFLAEAIESCLNQTHRNLEIIVVDDASPDGCAELAARYASEDERLRLVRRTTNGGIARAFNTGFDSARGDYFTRLAQDDSFEPDALEVMLRHLALHPEVGLVYCDYQSMDEAGKVTGRRSVAEPDIALSWRNSIGLCLMWRRSVWEKVGWFDPELDTAEDFDYWLRISWLFPLAKLTGPAPLRVRSHLGMASVQMVAKQEQASTQVVEKSCRKIQSSLNRFFLRRKGLAYVAFSAAFDYRETGQLWRALHRMVRSFSWWPLPFRRSEVKTFLARPKLTVLIAFRILRGWLSRA